MDGGIQWVFYKHCLRAHFGARWVRGWGGGGSPTVQTDRECKVLWAAGKREILNLPYGEEIWIEEST
jgi:hypothetical protein